MTLKKLSLMVCSLMIVTACSSAPKGTPTTLPTIGSQTSQPNSSAPITSDQRAQMPKAPSRPINSNFDRPATNLADRTDVNQFIERVSQQHNLDKSWLTDVFNHTSIKTSIITAMDRPAEGKIWGQYRPIFMTEKRINDGVIFYRQHQSALERAEREYGVNAEVIAAIIGVETSYGQNRGSWAVIDALSTLAFEYPRRASFFMKELENFLTIADETRFDPFSYKGSYAGAMGYPQFMPSSYLAYAVDFDGDGVRDLWNNPVDAIGSVANYLAKHNWVRNAPITSKVTINPNNQDRHLSYMHSGRLVPPNHSLAQLKNSGIMTTDSGNRNATLFRYQNTKEPVSYEWWIGYDNFYSITRYNHSQMYALAVFQLSDAIKSRL